MLSIKYVEDKQMILPYCRRQKRLYTAALYLFIAADGDETLATGMFEVGGEQVQVLHYETAHPDDYFLFDAVLRAGFNYASEQGIIHGYIPEEFRQTHMGLFGRINFPIQPQFNITNFFQKYKTCANIR